MRYSIHTSDTAVIAIHYARTDSDAIAADPDRQGEFLALGAFLDAYMAAP